MHPFGSPVMACQKTICRPIPTNKEIQDSGEVNMYKYDFLIVGSGLWASVFARQIMDAGKKCLILEKRSQIGGNLYCEEINEINVHRYGPHIFHTNNKKIWEYFNKYAQCNGFINSPVAKYKNEVYNLPFNMNTFSKMWGISTPDEARRIIEAQRRLIVGEPQNLEEQAISLVGKEIYEKLIKGFTEKQWGDDCSNLPPFIIKRLPVRYTFDNNYFNDRYQGIPIGGYNVLIKNLLKGADIELNVDYNVNREKYKNAAEKIAYTGTLDSFYNYILGKLEYRSLRFEDEIIDCSNYQGVAVVNYTDREVPYTRIIEHKHFEFGTQMSTVITREYPVKWSEGMEPFYPVNNDRNQLLYEKYAKMAAKESNVIFGGRLAEYKYYDMDKVIESALEASAKALENAEGAIS